MSIIAVKAVNYKGETLNVVSNSSGKKNEQIFETPDFKFTMSQKHINKYLNAKTKVLEVGYKSLKKF